MITDTETVRKALLDFKIADHYADKIIEEIELRSIAIQVKMETDVTNAVIENDFKHKGHPKGRNVL